MHKYITLTAADVSVGDRVFVIYCSRPVGVASKTLPITVRSIGPKWVTLSNGVKVDASGNGMFGMVFELVAVDMKNLAGSDYAGPAAQAW